MSEVLIDKKMELRELEDAFSLFNELNEQAKDSYTSLKQTIKFLSDELKQKNQELTTVKNRLANILESISDGVVAFDVTGDVLTINHGAQQIIGMEQMPSNMGQCYEFAGVEFAPLFDVVLQMQQGDNKPLMRDVVISRPGEVLNLSTSASPLINDEGSVTGAVLSFKDRTEIFNLQDEVKRRERLSALGEMTAGVAHEIRNPLGGIILYADSLKVDLEEAGMETRLVEKIIRGVQALDKVVSQMLTFTREMEIPTSLCLISTIVDNALEMTMAGGLFERVQVKKNVYRDQLRVLVDPDYVVMSLSNIMRNACEAMQGVGDLHVSVDMIDGMVAAVIKDSGPGIPEDALERIFHPFFTKGKKKGVGLGLAISYRFIEEFGGTIRARNGETQGACFEILLPLGAKR